MMQVGQSGEVVALLLFVLRFDLVIPSLQDERARKEWQSQRATDERDQDRDGKR